MTLFAPVSHLSFLLFMLHLYGGAPFVSPVVLIQWTVPFRFCGESMFLARVRGVALRVLFVWFYASGDYGALVMCVPLCWFGKWATLVRWHSTVIPCGDGGRGSNAKAGGLVDARLFVRDVRTRLTLSRHVSWFPVALIMTPFLFFYYYALS